MLRALAAERSRIVDLDAQIQDLERALAALRLEKAVVQNQLKSYKYPVLTLPNEIIAEIFIHFLPVYPACPPLIGPFSSTLLTQICRKWRNIARTTPALWKAISVSYDKIPSAYPVLISDFLGRSGSCPLSIELAIYYGDRHAGPIALEAALAHHERWERLELDIEDSDLPVIEGDFPLLRHVELDFHRNFYHFIILEAPLLRTAVLSAVDSSKIVLPWEQLTSLTLEHLEADYCALLLPQACNLVHCKLILYDTGFDNDDPPPDVILPCLQSLTCDIVDIGLDNDGYDGFLDAIVVPALRCLQIEEIFLRPNPIDSLASFMAKSSCKLAKLVVTGKRSIPASSYRKAFPSIGKFSFDGEADEDDQRVESNSDS